MSERVGKGFKIFENVAAVRCVGIWSAEDDASVACITVRPGVGF